MRNVSRRVLFALLVISYPLILIIPHFSRIMDFSLYSDDASRILDLQTRPLGALLFRPFNEHMAPFFEMISWITWQAAGERLTRAPIAFTIASYIPFVLCLGLLALWIRRETNSLATALSASILFGLAPLSIETIYWYSASSFTWALLWTMLGLYCSRPMSASGVWPARLGLFAGSILAPSSSAIGLLAGPLASIRIIASPGPGKSRWWKAAIPLAGSLTYLLICSMFRYQQVILVGLGRKTDQLGGLSLALQAPAARLIPGMLGFHDADLWLPASLNLALTAAGLVVIAFLSYRSRHRGLIVAGVASILLGYSMIYPFRNEHGSHWLFQVERFHLFPQLGLVLLASLAATRWLRRLDRDLLSALAASVGLGLVLLTIHFGRFERQASLYRFPEQRQTLCALERLGSICQDHHLSREDCIMALEPSWNRWYQPSSNGIGMVPARVGLAVYPPSDARELLLGQLSAADRKAIWGGMDVSKYTLIADDLAGPRPSLLASSRLIESKNAHCEESPEALGLRSYAMTGWPSDLVYEWTRPDSSSKAGVLDPRFLKFSCGYSAEPLEICWANRGEPWSPSRSVRFRSESIREPREWVIPLDCLPHWDPVDSGRIRVRFAAGPLLIGEPQLLR
jgi:hypothetical protein